MTIVVTMVLVTVAVMLMMKMMSKGDTTKIH